MPQVRTIKRSVTQLAASLMLASSLLMGGQVGAAPNTGSGPVINMPPINCYSNCTWVIVWVTVGGVRIPVLKKVCATLCL